MTDQTPRDRQTPRNRASDETCRSADPAPVSTAELAMALAGWAAGVRTALCRRASRVVAPVLRPLMLLGSLPLEAPPRWAIDLARGGRDCHATVQHYLSRLLDRVIPFVASAILDRLDLTALVKDQIDLDDVIRTVDLEAIIDRLDLVGPAREVMDAVDLPEIIRESTGSVASETVRVMRLRGVTGDEAVGRSVDRLLRRQARAVGPSQTGWLGQEGTRAPPGPGSDSTSA